MLICFFVSFIVSSILCNKLISIDQSSSRNAKVDGFRGILASMVALFHYSATYNIEKTGNWLPYDIHILKNMGSVAVSIFFMISGYLFYSVVSRKYVCWKSFYLSRLLRIYPLYITIISIIAITAYSIGDGTSFEYLIRYFEFRWGPLFGYDGAYIINSGVQWTLLYEVFFYAALPAIWSLKQRTATIWLIVSIVFACAAHYLYKAGEINLNLFLLFIMGGICRFVVSKKKRIISSFIMLFPALLSLLVAYLYADPYSYIQMTFLFFFFSLILASGNKVKVLSNKYSLVMGDVSYGIYMIHGVVIFLIFRSGIINTKVMSAWVYFSLFPLVMIAVTFLASYSLIYIERPSMKLAVNISKKIKMFGAK